MNGVCLEGLQGRVGSRWVRCVVRRGGPASSQHRDLEEELARKLRQVWRPTDARARSDASRGAAGAAGQPHGEYAARWMPVLGGLSNKGLKV